MATYAGRYSEIFLDLAGNPLVSAQVSVRLVGTSTPATLYTDKTKATTASNPFTTDSRGNGTFFAEPGDYDLFYNGQTLTVTVFDDPGENNAREFAVEDYGPVGAADDTATFQAAIAAAIAAGGGEVVAPDRQCIVANLTINNAADIHFRGAGPRSILKLKAATAASVLVISNSARIEVSGLTFDGSAVTNGSQPAIQYVDYNGIRVATSTDVSVHDCVLRNNWAAGILAGDSICSRLNFSHNLLYANGDNQIFLRPGCDHADIIGNMIGQTLIFKQTATTAGGTFGGSITVNVTAGTATAFPGAGLGHLVIPNTAGELQDLAYSGKTADSFTGVTGGQGSFASGAPVYYRGYSAIGAIRSNYITCVGNVVRDNGPGNADAAGIVFVGCQYFTIEDNIVDRCQPNGIFINWTDEGQAVFGGSEPLNKPASFGVVKGNVIDGVNSPANIGIFIGNCDRLAIIGNVVVGAGAYGFSADAPQGNGGLTYSDILVAGNVFADSVSNGVQCASVAVQGNRLVFSGNLVKGSGAHGLYLAGGPSARARWIIEGNTIVGSALEGLVCASGAHWEVRNNWFANNGGNGINVSTTDGNVYVTGNTFENETGTPTQQRGVYEGAGASSGPTHLVGNRFRAQSLEEWNFSNSNSRAKDNEGLVTRRDRNTGTATIPNGATSIAVTHGLYKAPTAQLIKVVPTNSPTNDPGNFWVSGIGATQFTLNVRSDPGASGATFAWDAATAS